jgi:hypothetical protein
LKKSYGIKNYIYLTTVLVIILILIFIKYYQPINHDSWNDLLKYTKLNEDEYVIIVFYNFNDCDICFWKNEQIIKCIMNNIGKEYYRIKIIAAVQCSRDIELIVFQKKFHWKYLLIRDKSNIRNKLDLRDFESIALFNDKGDKIVTGDLMSDDFCRKVCNKILSEE